MLHATNRLTDEDSISETGRKASLNHKKTIKYEKISNHFNQCNLCLCDGVCLQDFILNYACCNQLKRSISCCSVCWLYYLLCIDTMLLGKIFNH